MDYKAFVDGDKTLLVAPAGYGKTYTIAECLKYTTGRHLILTHTHAGVASIKEKIRKSAIPSSHYSVETISSVAQKYVNAFYVGNDVPDQDDSKSYHRFLIDRAIEIFRTSLVKSVIRATYTGLFVDEYQDCNTRQHEMILALSESMKTHILGDPMQAIFNFNGDLVDFDRDLSGFETVPELSTPHRWCQEGNNRLLGDWLKEARDLLDKKEPIDFSSINVDGLHFLTVGTRDFWDSKSAYRKSLHQIISNRDQNPDYESLLVLVPEYEATGGFGQRERKGNVNDRSKIRAQIDYGKSLELIEAIDDLSIYALAKKADTLIEGIGRAKNKVKRIQRDILGGIFNVTDLNGWFNETGLKRKTSAIDKAKSARLETVIDGFIASPSANNLRSIILVIKNELGSKYKREGKLYAILKALKESQLEEISTYSAMKNQRNVIRGAGRKILGKCIGTTLLTKGLEFDTVVILDADKIDCPKHLYVALTRGCKNLFVFSAHNSLSPYDQ